RAVPRRGAGPCDGARSAHRRVPPSAHRVASHTSMSALLEVDGLVKHFDGRGGTTVHAVDGISFSIAPGETLALVGESGWRRAATGRLVLALLEPTSGAIRFDGNDIVGRRARDLKDLRRRAQIVFQDPFASFDPRRRVGDSVVEPLVAQGRRAEAN